MIVPAWLGARRTVDSDEPPILAIDDRAGSKVECREPVAGLDRAGEEIEPGAKQNVVLGGLPLMSACTLAPKPTCTP